MVKHKKLLLIVTLIVFSLHVSASEKKELLFYIGSTMIQPIVQLSKEFEETHNCKIKIIQDASQNLYDTIKSTKKGDLYLAGDPSYRTDNLNDGILLDGSFVGYNRIVIVVKKGNPKNIKADLSELTNPRYKIAIGDDETSSIGKISKKVLMDYGNYKQVIYDCLFMSPDSRIINVDIKENEIDLSLNWYSTALKDNIKRYVEALKFDFENKYTKMLILNLLSTSKHPSLTKEFMKFASSKRGREVFKKYGFLNDKDIENFNKRSF